jgi:hypothetical protein
VGDIIHFSLPLGSLGRLAHTLRVRAKLDEIFIYRSRAIEREFGITEYPAEYLLAPLENPDPMRMHP